MDLIFTTVSAEESFVTVATETADILIAFNPSNEFVLPENLIVT